MGYTPQKDTKFSGTEKMVNLTALAGGTFDLSAATTARVPTVAGTSDNSTKAASTAFVQAVAGTLATQAYVDSAVQGLDAKASVRLGTAATLAITGKTTTTLTVGGTTLTIDGTAAANGDRIWVKDGTSGASGTAGASSPENGIYTVSGIGSSVVLTRAADADTFAELVGAYAWIEIGSTNSDSGWICTSDQGGTLGTTGVTVIQFNGAGQITAGAGLTKTGNTVDVGAGTGITVNANDIQIANLGITNAMIAAGTIDLTTKVTGLLPLTNGGTGVSSSFGFVDIGSAQNIAGLKTFTTGLSLSLAGPAQVAIRSTGSSAQLVMDSAAANTAQIIFQNATSNVGFLNASASSINIQDLSARKAFDLALASGNVTLGNGTGTLVSAATQPAVGDSSTNVATTAFVQGEHIARGDVAPVRLATVVSQSAAGTYANGSSGVGATFTYTATGVVSIDGVAIALNDRILLMGNTPLQNGVYKVTTAGAVGVAAVLTRATDFDASADMTPGALIPIVAGTEWGGSVAAFKNTSPPTVGTTGLTFAVITLSPGAQTIAGTKTFSGTPTFSAGFVSSAAVAITGGILLHLTTVANASFPYTLTTNDDVVVTQQTAVGKVLTLPSAFSPGAGRVVIIKDGSAAGAETYPITINAAGGETIDGLSSFPLDSNAQAVSLMSDGNTAWYVV